MKYAHYAQAVVAIAQFGRQLDITIAANATTAKHRHRAADMTGTRDG